MGKAADELTEAAEAALAELTRIEAALEEAARDTTDRHLAGRIRDAATRVEYVARALGQELDRNNPSRSMLHKLLAAGAAALGLVGLPLVVEDISDRVDTIDVAGELIEAVVGLLGDQRAHVEEATAGYFVQLERFEASRRTVKAQVSFRGEGSLGLGDPQVDGGSAADVLTDENGEPLTDDNGEPLLASAQVHPASASGGSRSSGSAAATIATPRSHASSGQVPEGMVRMTGDVAPASDVATGEVDRTLPDRTKDGVSYATTNIVEDEPDPPSERYNEGLYGDGTYQGDGD